MFNRNFYPKYVYYSFPANPVSLGYRRHFKYLKEKYIKECGLETQYAIVKELDNVESAIFIAKERLLALDELVKSRFISREAA